jgi:hypothetical protein
VRMRKNRNVYRNLLRKFLRETRHVKVKSVRNVMAHGVAREGK